MPYEQNDQLFISEFGLALQSYLDALYPVLSIYGEEFLIARKFEDAQRLSRLVCHMEWTDIVTILNLNGEPVRRSAIDSYDDGVKKRSGRVSR